MVSRAARSASRRHWRSICVDTNGQGLAEYLIIVVIVAVAVILAIRYFGGSVGNQFSDANQKLTKAGSSDTVSKSSKNDTSDGSNEVSDDSSNRLAKESGGSSRSDGSNSAGLGDPSGGIGDAPSGEGEDIDALADSMSRGVGDDTGSKPIEQIEISWGTLAFLAFIICCLGVYLVARFSKKVRKQSDKGKKKKKKSFFDSVGPSKKSDQSGQAMVEFVLSVISFLFCILGVIQLALALNAYTLVRYAAYNAARAGIVHGGDLGQMREAARISLLAIFPRHGRADHLRGFTENYLGALATDQNPINTQFLEPITQVRIIDNNALPSGKVVTFDDPVEGENAIITVQVVHRYELVIPLVNRIIYYIYQRIRTFQGYQQETINNLSAETDRLRKSGNLRDIEYRIPIVSHYTMRLQSDYVVP